MARNERRKALGWKSFKGLRVGIGLQAFHWGYELPSLKKSPTEAGVPLSDSRSTIRLEDLELCGVLFGSVGKKVRHT